jgi:hypothetical protein
VPAVGAVVAKATRAMRLGEATVPAAPDAPSSETGPWPVAGPIVGAAVAKAALGLHPGCRSVYAGELTSARALLPTALEGARRGALAPPTNVTVKWTLGLHPRCRSVHADELASARALPPTAPEGALGHRQWGGCRTLPRSAVVVFFLQERGKYTALTGEASSAREMRALVRSLCDPVHWA